MTFRAARPAPFVSTLAAAVLAAAGAFAEAPPPGRHVKATLVAETDAVAPGRALVAGIRLQMDAGWHTYWRNPGDSGLPTRVRWTLPGGFAAGELQWPVPERFATGPLVSFGYSGDVLLPVEIRVPAAFTAKEARLAVRVDWLECREACLPGRSELTLALPVRAAPRPGKDAALFAQARQRLPSALPGWTVEAAADPAQIVLGVRAATGEDVTDAYFYPLEPRVLDHAQAQKLERAGARHYRLRLVRDPNGAAVERLGGVLVVETARGRRALPVDAAVPAPARASRE